MPKIFGVAVGGAGLFGGGTVSPYRLHVQGMQERQRGDGRVCYRRRGGQRFSAPTNAKHVQMKSLDTGGEPRWTKNEFSVGLTAGGSAAVLVSRVFEKEGEYKLTIGVENVNPGDFDASNTPRRSP